MVDFNRMEVKVISKTGKRQNGAIGENSAQSAVRTLQQASRCIVPDRCRHTYRGKVETKRPDQRIMEKEGIIIIRHCFAYKCT